MRTRGTICQYGSRFNDYPVYRGVSRQYGNGLGSIFKAALRTVTPILKPLAKVGIQSAKKVAKDHGIKALREIVKGQNVKQVLKHRGKSALKSFGQSAVDQVSEGIKSNQKSKKPQSKSRHRPVHKGRRTLTRKNLRFPPDFLSK